ncbi:MAG: hypothetical protein U0638_13895 [Phycisphaerales bacterium]
MRIRTVPTAAVSGPAAHLAAAIALASCSIALAQPCTPQWFGDVGTPGSNGYVGAFATHNFGQGKRVFAGGAFTRMANISAAKGVAQYNPATNTWSAMGGGVYTTNTNYFVAALTTYNTPAGVRLLVGGWFATASNVPNTANLAAWDGAAWSSFTTPPDGAIWSFATWNNDLYVGGGFANIGGVGASCIAKYDGTTFTPLAAGITGDFAPNVFAMTVYDDGNGPALYAAGRFNNVDGQNIQLLARWNGSTWSKVGTGITRNASTSDLSAITVFDDGNGPALYVGGYDYRPTGKPTTSVARWDGVSWTNVGANLGGRTTCFAVFNDGTGAKLYAGGTAQPGINYVYRLEGGQWVTLSGGVSGTISANFPSVFAMKADTHDLYVGGEFTAAGSVAGKGVVRWHACDCAADFNHDGYVNGNDYDLFAEAFDAADHAADFNADGFVNGDDYDAFAARFDQGC